MDAPSIAIDRDGVVHAAWRETTDDEIAIVHRQLAEGGAWTSAERLSEGFQVLGSPTVLRRPDGADCVAWPGFPIAEGLSSTGLYLRCGEAAGWSSPALAERTGLSTRARPAFDPDGVLRVVEVASPWPVSLGDSVLSPPRVLIHSASFAIDADGGWHVVWQQRGEAGGQFHRLSQDGGQTWGDAVRIDRDGRIGDQAALIVADEQGRVHAAWFDGKAALYRVWTRDGGWAPIEIVPASSSTRAMVVDTAGRPTIFLGVADGISRIARAEDGAWSPVDRVASSDGVEELAAAAGADGHAHLLWTTSERVPVMRTLEVEIRPSS